MSKVQSNQGFKWMLIIAAFLLLPGLVALGFWQLERAEQKEMLLQSWSDIEIRRAIPGMGEFTSQPFISVELEGQFDSARFFLLDNRIRDGIVGYEVIALFYVQNYSALLVNLGWVKADYDRHILPDIELPIGMHKLAGSIRKIDRAFVLNEEPSHVVNRWPQVVQSLDPDFLAGVLQESVPPLLLQSKKIVISGLDINWPVILMTPEKHLGYAVQWFAMAVALGGLLLWSWWSIRREMQYE